MRVWAGKVAKWWRETMRPVVLPVRTPLEQAYDEVAEAVHAVTDEEMTTAEKIAALRDAAGFPAEQGGRAYTTAERMMIDGGGVSIDSPPLAEIMPATGYLTRYPEPGDADDEEFWRGRFQEIEDGFRAEMDVLFASIVSVMAVEWEDPTILAEFDAAYAASGAR